MTTSTAPPREVTDEASEQGLRLAREAGDAYRRMVGYFIEHVATSGSTQEVEDFAVGLATEEAEPLWQLLGGELELTQPPKDANAHLEVVVMDRADGRFVPGLMVHVAISRSGQELGTHRLPFLWHPTMYHYGHSVHIPEAGEYDLKVFIEAPTFGRHDKTNGRRYGKPVTVEFRGMRMEPGRKT